MLEQSAVKCVHAYAVCGYCQLCTGFFAPEPNELTTAAENQLCPTAAIKRTYVEDPYYQYSIDEQLCIGCAKCVEGCNRFGNGSLFLQIRHDRCLNCNECAISRTCPGDGLPPRAGGPSLPAQNHQPLNAQVMLRRLKFIWRAGSDVASGADGLRRATVPAAGF